MRVIKPAGGITVNSYGENCRCICSSDATHNSPYMGTYYHATPCACQCSYGTANHDANYAISSNR
ncbi:hypothetical protein [Inconstantimicrobium mannanitabidum]|uniref:Uncharacterized protein n=1 Tax=Inconstantimicrobium mannanitabidum TaxID=1604901 RepID=A0ACB5RHJ8_9CLOT|nr:hypothetical protein [Clostridium sp. TW13]GKX68539.1 hypothetical protein rsdtw13_37970 [Clostridium sp. TW13]